AAAALTDPLFNGTKTYRAFAAGEGYVCKVCKLCIHARGHRPTPFIVKVGQTHLVEPKQAGLIQPVVLGAGCITSPKWVHDTEHVKANLTDVGLAHNRYPVLSVKERKGLIYGPGLAITHRTVPCFLRFLKDADANIHPVFLRPDQLGIPRSGLG